MTLTEKQISDAVSKVLPPFYPQGEFRKITKTDNRKDNSVVY